MPSSNIASTGSQPFDTLKLQDFQEKYNIYLESLLNIIKESPKLRNDLKENIQNSVEGLRQILSQQNELLKDQLEVSNKTLDPVITYADIVKNKQKSKEQNKTKFVVAIYPKDKTMKYTVLKGETDKKINPEPLKLGVNRVKNIAQNGLLMECHDINTCKILAEKYQ